MAYAFSNETIHELAMLYLQQQDLSGKTPAEVCKLYMDVVRELINTAHNWEL